MVSLIVLALMFTALTVTIEGKPASDEDKLKCEQNGYKKYSTGCYKLHDIAVSWDTANTTCAGEGAYLVILNDKAEADTVTDICRDSDGSYDWVGLRDENGNDNWKSIHGDKIESLYHVWADTHQGKYKCGGLKYTGEIDDIPCNRERCFVCEK